MEPLACVVLIFGPTALCIERADPFMALLDPQVEEQEDLSPHARLDPRSPTLSLSLSLEQEDLSPEASLDRRAPTLLTPPVVPGSDSHRKGSCPRSVKVQEQILKLVPSWNRTGSKMTSLAVSSLKAAASLPATTF